MILQSALLPLPPVLMRLAFGLHIVWGTVGLLAGTVAVLALLVFWGPRAFHGLAWHARAAPTTG